MRGSFGVMLVLLLGGGCGKEKLVANETWHTFEGIEYRAPKGAVQQVQDGVLPGPGGLGGIPSGQHIEARITSQEGKLFMSLVRSAAPKTLEATEKTLEANHIARGLAGKTTPTGWELTYEQIDTTGASIGKVHVVYADVAGGHYECTWAEVNCGDHAAADALCRSLRPKR